MELQQALAAEVRAQVAARRWTRLEAQRAFGIASSTYNRYFINGDRDVPFTLFCDVATALGYAPSELARRVESRAADMGPSIDGATARELADVDITRQVVDAARTLRIAVHDHLVVGRDGVASLKALGLM